jgi:rhodanese-related sulfurtransferase
MRRGEVVADPQGRIGELPPDAEYVAYCRGPCCVFADEAVALLRSKGRKARRLFEGYPEWQLAGRPVHVATSIDPDHYARR